MNRHPWLTDEVALWLACIAALTIVGVSIVALGWHLADLRYQEQVACRDHGGAWVAGQCRYEGQTP